MRKRYLTLPVLITLFSTVLLLGVTEACSQPRGTSPQTPGVLTGQGAFGDWTTDAPGVRRRITTADLPKPYETRSVTNGPRLTQRPPKAWPQVPKGFKVEEFLTGLTNPRLIRTAPNGDLFVAESMAGLIRVLRVGKDPGKAEVNEVFAAGLKRPFGIAFYLTELAPASHSTHPAPTRNISTSETRTRSYASRIETVTSKPVARLKWWLQIFPAGGR